MPHPRIMMIPMGCVLGVTISNDKYRIDVISKAAEIPAGNPELEFWADQIFVDDDYGLGPTEKKTFHSFTILDSTIEFGFSNAHFAYKVPMNVGSSARTRLKPAEYTGALRSNYFYFVMGLDIPDGHHALAASVKRKILKAQELREAAAEKARKTKSKTSRKPTAKSTKSGKKGSKRSVLRKQK